MKELKEEVTYATGDRFRIGRCEYILARTMIVDNMVALINLENGDLCSNGAMQVDSTNHVTPAELSSISGGSYFTKISRKKESIIEKAEILKRVEQREYEKRCVMARICPYCGEDLAISNDCLSSGICKRCNLSFPYVQ